MKRTYSPRGLSKRTAKIPGDRAYPWEVDALNQLIKETGKSGSKLRMEGLRKFPRYRQLVKENREAYASKNHKLIKEIEDDPHIR
jgi:hypothetical protein